MSQKQLYFLSDSTLCESLFDPKKAEPSLDGPLFKKFIENDQKKNRPKKIRFWISLIIFPVTITTLLFYLALNNTVSEGVIGMLLFFSFVCILAFYYSFKPESKKRSEYRETFLSIIKKDRILEKITKQEIFNALMIRVHVITHDEVIQNKHKRLERIITSINEYEDTTNKIFKIPVKLASNIGEIIDLFQEKELPRWAQDFTQRHSMQDSSCNKEKFKETLEEILA